MALLQKRPVISGGLLIVATPYPEMMLTPRSNAAGESFWTFIKDSSGDCTANPECGASAKRIINSVFACASGIVDWVPSLSCILPRKKLIFFLI